MLNAKNVMLQLSQREIAHKLLQSASPIGREIK